MGNFLEARMKVLFAEFSSPIFNHAFVGVGLRPFSWELISSANATDLDENPYQTFIRRGWTMVKAKALVAGLEVGGWQKDVEGMSSLLRNCGFDVKTLEGSAATRDAILGEIKSASERFEPNDFFVFHFSGHGAQRSESSSGDEGDNKDELLCVANRQTIVDDELWALWKEFVEQVRIVLLTDSCHSGTVARALPRAAATRGADASRGDDSSRYEWDPVQQTRSRNELPPPRFPNMGLKPQARTRGASSLSDMVAASMIHISGCRDEQESWGSSGSGGRFTNAFIDAYNRVANQGYEELYRQIKQTLSQSSNRQDSQLNYYGNYLEDFRRQPVLRPSERFPV